MAYAACFFALITVRGQRGKLRASIGWSCSQYRSLGCGAGSGVRTIRGTFSSLYWRRRRRHSRPGDPPGAKSVSIYLELGRLLSDFSQGGFLFWLRIRRLSAESFGSWRHRSLTEYSSASTSFSVPYPCLYRRGSALIRFSRIPVLIRIGHTRWRGSMTFWYGSGSGSFFCLTMVGSGSGFTVRFAFRAPGG